MIAEFTTWALCLLILVAVAVWLVMDAEDDGDAW